MATVCGTWSHKWKNKTRIVRPGVYQRECSRCGKIQNKKCGGFFNPHQFKRDKRTRAGTLTCKKCGTKQRMV